MKENPTQVKFEKPAKRKLEYNSRGSGVSQADIIRLAVDEFFAKRRTPGDVLLAHMNARVAKNA